MTEADEQLYRIRHSLSHVMAQAVLQLRPGSTLGFGPPIADGFYYDFVLTEPLTEEDFPEIEKRMKQIIKEGQPFEQEELERDAAFARLAAMGEPYKREYAEELFEKKGIAKLGFYTNGPFLDMCEGPHVESTRALSKVGFKLRSVAGAYWRGDSRNQMMTRLYAWAFETRVELDAYVKAWKEAQARDHKKLGKELDLFVIDEEIGKGLPLWLPNGTIIRDELEKLAKELEFKAGYVRVATPHIAKTSLYYKTGHLPYYASHMYPFMELKETREGEHGTEEEVRETYCLRPMNCPHHHKVFASRPRSYRDLPLRLAEYGQVYRFEDSGALSGLLRVRGMAMNDAHIYCTEEQVKDEFLAVMKMHQEAYDILGLTDYYFRFSTWDPEDPKGKQKYIDDPQGWETTQRLVHEAMVESGAKFVIGKGEAAFYGPKIDVQFKTVTGREETASTNQLDFGIAERLDLEYVGPDNKMHRPYIIHRAPLGTHERFVAFLIEHYGGAFPTWLAPVQVRVVTVGERFDDYAEEVVAQLRGQFIRAERDKSSDTMGKKIRNAVTSKIPNILIVGEREAEDGTVTLRRYGREEQLTMPLAELQADVLRRIAARKDD
ncbi:MAG: threonine--tRNA ligase [Deltaproteobacteria bacterium HGW-Deltaproteobacteria-14]|nr:MAG: threonine--tRNA ligase [Deltaproteobacteria bacterium HGW-Deltaproteobacteria-14]